MTGGKAWPLRPTEAPQLLRTLGLLSADASMPADAVRKFSQINHMVTLLLPQLEDLVARQPLVRILDACCGTSYLTLILAWLLKEKWKKPCRIVGLDANPAVIKTSAKRAAEMDLEDVLRFEARVVDPADGAASFGRLFPKDGDVEGVRPHLLVALHACDTATDLAFALGIRAKADAMAVAPCCHAELAKKWKDIGTGAGKEHAFGPIFRSPNLRRETAAQLTDALRMLLVRSHGYEVTATEFVPAEHTPKNRLLVCVRRGRYHEPSAAEYAGLKAALGGEGIKLEELLREAPVDA